MLHHGCKHESAHKRDAQRIGHGAVVLVKGILVDVEPQPCIKVFKENAAHIVALADDDGVLLAELLQIGKRGAEHRMSGHITASALLVEVFQSGLHRCYVAEDAVFGQMWQHFVECGNGVLHRHGIDDKLRTETFNLLQRSEAPAVVREAHPHGVFLVYGRLVVETEQVEEKTAHLACSQY